MNHWEAGEQRVREILRNLDRVAIAWSGGVDSTYLALIARQELGARARVLTLVSALMPERELVRLRRTSQLLQLDHVELALEPLADPQVRANPPDRCYHCKRLILAAARAWCDEQGIPNLLDGENQDDRGDYRPGNQAAVEQGVLRPLAQAAMGKNDIRLASAAAGLEDPQRASEPCLATRIEFGCEVTRERLDLAQRLEDRILQDLPGPVRARIGRTHVRLEVPQAQLQKLICDPLKQDLVTLSQAAGIPFISLDLEGFVSGKLNRTHLK